MKTYIEISVPIRYNAHWFESLRTVLNNVNVRWQKGYYHITMAFMDETAEGVDWKQILDRHFSQTAAFEMTFDKIDVFTSRPGKHIINLTATQVPQRFLSLVEDIRNEMVNAGCKIQSSFKLHVTLGRASFPDFKLLKIREIIETVTLPQLSLTLTEVDFRVFRGPVIYETSLSK
ncbi:MAG: 2'-5' RNA ligase family protein [Muribaculaceae bacterium]|nr:2'-5' RNA ligase family protein [Muribaculaceae bacterium]